MLLVYSLHPPTLLPIHCVLIFESSHPLPSDVPPLSLYKPQDLIGMIDDHFLDHLEEMEESSSNEDYKSSIFGINFAHKTKRSRSVLSLENDTEDVYVVGKRCVHCIVVYCRGMCLLVCGPCIVQVCMLYPLYMYVYVWNKLVSNLYAAVVLVCSTCFQCCKVKCFHTCHPPPLVLSAYSFTSLTSPSPPSLFV